MGWVLPVIKGVLDVMSAITFIQFIEEEAIQSAGLGAFLAIRSRDYNSAWLAIHLLEDELVPHLDSINSSVGWIAIYSKGAFYDFIQAQKTNIVIYKNLCTAGKK